MNKIQKRDRRFVALVQLIGGTFAFASLFIGTQFLIDRWAEFGTWGAMLASLVTLIFLGIGGAIACTCDVNSPRGNKPFSVVIVIGAVIAGAGMFLCVSHQDDLNAMQKAFLVISYPSIVLVGGIVSMLFVGRAGDWLEGKFLKHFPAQKPPNYSIIC